MDWCIHCAQVSRLYLSTTLRKLIWHYPLINHYLTHFHWYYLLNRLFGNSNVSHTLQSNLGRKNTLTRLCNYQAAFLVEARMILSRSSNYFLNFWGWRDPLQTQSPLNRFTAGGWPVLIKGLTSSIGCERSSRQPRLCETTCLGSVSCAFISFRWDWQHMLGKPSVVNSQSARKGVRGSVESMLLLLHVTLEHHEWCCKYWG